MNTGHTTAGSPAPRGNPLLSTLCVVSAILNTIAGLGVASDQGAAPLALVPKPLRVERKAGAFTLNKDTVILAEKDAVEADDVGRLLADRLNRSTGLGIEAKSAEGDGPVPNAIVLTTKSANANLGAEGYQLEVTPDGVVIAAAEGAGLFYGTQTLLQLLPPEVFSPNKVAETVAWTSPAVQIEDRPRFPWRGLMVNVCRHFFNKDEIKSFLDLMAQHKLNLFHWHLTEDQAWRIEIKRYPKLTEVGAWRKDIGFRLDPKSSTAWGPDGRYGGFYTQDDVREIVAYAKARYITVVPEIEMPGHAIAALASYPELSCTGRPYSTNIFGGEYSDIFCAGKDSTFEFLEGVLAEVIDLFPSKLIHIGGDEAGKAQWKKCEKCQARIRQEGLKDENQLQSYFVRRIEKFLNAHGRNLIGWDEILDGGLAPNAAVMSWRGLEGGIAAANTGHDAVMCPQTHLYINRAEAPAETPVNNPRPNRGLLTLDMVYGYEPVPQEIAGEKAKHILGAEGPLWSEGIANYARLQYLTYPRACAIAELTWSEAQQKNWPDFRRRIKGHLERLKVQAVNYYPSL